MAERRLSWPLRGLWALVAVGCLAFTLALVGAVHRQRALDVTQRRIDVLAHQARWSASHGAPDEALLALRELSTLDPRRPRLAYELGVVLLELRQVPEALGHLQRAVAQAPGDGVAWRALNQAQLQGGDLAGAATSLERAALLDPPSADAGRR